MEDEQAKVPHAGFRQLLGELEGLDWEAEYPRIHRALDKLWREAGWIDEADRFAYEVARDATTIPPWRFLKRIALVTDRVANRYELTPEQATRVQSAMLGELTALLMRHGGVIVKQAREALADRAQGKPFRPEQIARWTKESDALFADGQASIDHVFTELRPMLGAKQRGIFERDRRAYKKRWTYVETVRRRWAEGGWQPDDWGMEEDANQRGQAPLHGMGQEPGPAGPAKDGLDERAAPLPQWLAHDPSTWFAYVLDFGKRFALDAGQMTTARSIHIELRQRASAYTDAHTEQLHAVPLHERATHDAYASIRLLFAELQKRLDAIPTTAQRQQAKGKP